MFGRLKQWSLGLGLVAVTGCGAPPEVLEEPAELASTHEALDQDHDLAQKKRGKGKKSKKGKKAKKSKKSKKGSRRHASKRDRSRRHSSKRDRSRRHSSKHDRSRRHRSSKRDRNRYADRRDHQHDGGCRGGEGGGADQRRALMVRELRSELTAHEVAPLPAAPEVTDGLYNLGQALAFDKILSGNRNISCMTCHHPNLGTDDDRALSLGEGAVGLGQTREVSEDGGAIIPRNTPALFNLHTYETMFWDSRVFVDEAGQLVTPAGEQLTPAMREALTFGVVAAQAMFPPTSREEMRGQPGENEIADIPDENFRDIWAALTRRVVFETPEYEPLLRAAYPFTPFEELTFAHLANAIAAFEVAAFASDGSPFERFVRGDDQALSEDQLSGALAFYKTGCADCHSGTSFSDFAHHNTFMAQLGPGKGDGELGLDDFGREQVTKLAGDRYKFRTPPLFNVALTAPYGHAGQHDTLLRHVQHYDRADKALWYYDITEAVENEQLHGSFYDNRRAVMAAGLDPEVRDLGSVDAERIVRFLHALSDPEAADLSHVVPESVPSGLSVED